MYLLKDLARHAGVSRATIRRRLNDAKFKKKSPGNYYPVKEARRVAEIVGFELPQNRAK